MSTYYIVDGMRVRILKSSYTGANLDILYRWASVDATQRAVYTEVSGLWYRAQRNAWSRGFKGKPKAIAMAETVDSVTKTSWKEIQDEIPTRTFDSI